MNITRYIARNPDRKVPYGTTGCEAVHGHIVSCLHGITQMTSRYADVFADVFTICKLLSGVLLRLDLHRAFTQAELLKVVGQQLAGLSLAWGESFKVAAASREVVDLKCLPKNAVGPHRNGRKVVRRS